MKVHGVQFGEVTISDRIDELQSCLLKYGDIPLSKLSEIEKEESMKRRGLPYRCPKCNTTGKVTVKHPGMHGYYEDSFSEVTCDLCKGEGWTNKNYKPKMIQDGWEEK